MVEMNNNTAKNSNNDGESTGHLDIFQLDALRSGEGTAQERAHLDSCARCQRELAGIANLVSDIKRLSTPPHPVPKKIDERILSAAHQELAPKRAYRPVFRRWPAWAGAAAAAVLLILVGVWFLQEGAFTRKAAQQRMKAKYAFRVPENFMPCDADGNGHIDILDAFTVAKRIDTGAPVNPLWDCDGNGSVDEKDVDVIAQKAVSLKGGDKI